MITKVSIQMALFMALAVPVLMTGCYGGHKVGAPHAATQNEKAVPSSAVVPVKVLSRGGIDYLTVPQTALFRQGSLQGVLAVSLDGRIESRWVSTGHSVGSELIVLAGLERGAQIVGVYDPELEGGVFVKQNQAAAEEVQSNE